MWRRWEVVLTNSRTDTRLFGPFWTRRGAMRYRAWLAARFPETIASFVSHGYILATKRRES